MNIAHGLTIEHPYAWAVAAGICDVLNLGYPVPPEALTRECKACGGSGSIGECDPVDLMPDQSPLEAWGYGCDDCMMSGFEPLRVLIHAGAGYDPKFDDSTNSTGTYRYARLPDGSLVGADLDPNDPYMSPNVRGTTGLPQPFSAVLGVATIRECHASSECWKTVATGNMDVRGGALHYEHRVETCSEWAQFSKAMERLYHWQVANVTRFAVPVPWTNDVSGLWKAPQELIEQVNQQ